MATGMSRAVAAILIGTCLIGTAIGAELHWNVQGGPRTGFHTTTGIRQASASCNRQFSAPRLEVCQGTGCCCIGYLYPFLTTCGGFNHWAYWSGCLRANQGYCEPYGCGCNCGFAPIPEMGFDPPGLQALGQIPNDAIPLGTAP